MSTVGDDLFDAIPQHIWQGDQLTRDTRRRDLAEHLVAALAQRLDEDWCDCNYEPVYGIKAHRHLPSCRYGIVLDYLDIEDPRAKEAPDG